MIKIIDIGFGNIASLHYSLLSINLNNKIINSPEEIIPEDKIILPGVGSIRNYMYGLRHKGFEKKIIDHFNRNKFLLGICIGLHALSKYSEEDGGIRCLNILDTKVIKMKEGKNNGWINISIKKNSFFKRKISGRVFYNHEYGLVKKKKSIKTLNIGNLDYISILKKKNFYGIQFHPEKSQKTGLSILKEILK